MSVSRPTRSIIPWFCLTFAAVLWLAATPLPGRAAEVVTADGQTVEGRIFLTEDGTITVKPPLPEDAPPPAVDPAPLLSVDLLDLDQALFGAMTSYDDGQALIQLPGRHTTQSASATIKLRSGMHRLVLAYWQGPGGADLDLQWSGPNQARGPIPSELLKRPRDTNAAVTASPGLDAEGFRLPDEPGETRSRITYTYYTIDSSKVDDADTYKWQMAEPFGLGEKKRAGSSSKIDLRLAGRASYYCLVFDGYVDVPTDGAYEFFLRSDDGAALFLGPPPAYVNHAGSMIETTIEPIDQEAWHPLAAKAWRVELSGADQLPAAGLTGWSDAAASFQAPLDEEDTLELDIPLDHVRALWPNLPGGSSIDRADEPADADSVYVRTAEDEIRRVSGVVLSLETQATDDDGEPRLTLRYDNQPRRIKLSRVAGLVLNHRPPPSADPTAVRQHLVLKNDLRLSGQWTSANADALSFTTDWGQAVQAKTTEVSRITNLNGRLVRLTQLTPVSVRETPYFTRVMPHRIDTALNGEAIRLFDNVTYAQGISVHAHTRLTYDIAGGFARLRAKAGLLNPNGKLGNVDLRVLGDDDRVLYEKLGHTADDPPVDIDVDVAGVTQLTLETDFGQGQDVGDRVGWVEPTLLRKSD